MLQVEDRGSKIIVMGSYDQAKIIKKLIRSSYYH